MLITVFFCSLRATLPTTAPSDSSPLLMCSSCGLLLGPDHLGQKVPVRSFRRLPTARTLCPFPRVPDWAATGTHECAWGLARETKVICCKGPAGGPGRGGLMCAHAHECPSLLELGQWGFLIAEGGWWHKLHQISILCSNPSSTAVCISVVSSPVRWECRYLWARAIVYMRVLLQRVYFRLFACHVIRKWLLFLLMDSFLVYKILLFL